MARVRNITNSIDHGEAGASFPMARSMSASGTGYTLCIQGHARVAVQATGTTTAGTFSCVALVKVSLDNSTYVTAGTFTLNGSSPQSDGMVIQAPWNFYKISLSSIGGTNAVLNVTGAV